MRQAGPGRVEQIYFIGARAQARARVRLIYLGSEAAALQHPARRAGAAGKGRSSGETSPPERRIGACFESGAGAGRAAARPHRTPPAAARQRDHAHHGAQCRSGARRPEPGRRDLGARLVLSTSATSRDPGSGCTGRWMPWCIAAPVRWRSSGRCSNPPGRDGADSAAVGASATAAPDERRIEIPHDILPSTTRDLRHFGTAQRRGLITRTLQQAADGGDELGDADHASWLVSKARRLWPLETRARSRRRAPSPPPALAVAVAVPAQSVPARPRRRRGSRPPMPSTRARRRTRRRRRRRGVDPLRYERRVDVSVPSGLSWEKFVVCRVVERSRSG